MSYDNAISKRGQMNLDYQKMLEEETDPTRQEAIKKQIKLNEEEIQQLRQGKPLFGDPVILKQETKIIEPDPETKGQKVTIINELPTVSDTEIPMTPSSKKIGNSLRDLLKNKKNLSAEESLKAKVLAAKAAKSL